jgi:CheY-like chemotaxis protein
MMNALIVDDNEVNTMILANSLELFGITTDQVHNGNSAIVMSKSTAYDIIFIDHFMPGMDGLKTTKVIRNICNHNIIIIALTSKMTEQIDMQYKNAGANDIYIKPLGLQELKNILIKWFPHYSQEDLPQPSNINNKNMHLDNYLADIKEINYTKGLRYALGDEAHYYNILKVSLKDINRYVTNMLKGFENQSKEDMRIYMHSLKSIFNNIGAEDLSAKAKLMEDIVHHNDMQWVKNNYNLFLNAVINFYQKLDNILVNFEKILQNEQHIQEQVYIPMTKEEYEQSLLNTIYYIKRYEYDSIISELKHLIHRSDQELKKEFMLILSEVKNFSYETALTKLMNL